MSWAWPRWSKPADELVVLDDFFPNLLTGFRVAEYNAYLGAFDNLRVLTALSGFATEHARYAARYPQFAPVVTTVVLASVAVFEMVDQPVHALPWCGRVRPATSGGPVLMPCLSRGSGRPPSPPCRGAR